MIFILTFVIDSYTLHEGFANKFTNCANFKKPNIWILSWKNTRIRDEDVVLDLW